GSFCGRWGHHALPAMTPAPGPPTPLSSVVRRAGGLRRGEAVSGDRRTHMAIAYRAAPPAAGHEAPDDGSEVAPLGMCGNCPPVRTGRRRANRGRAGREVG